MRGLLTTLCGKEGEAGGKRYVFARGILLVGQLRGRYKTRIAECECEYRFISCGILISDTCDDDTHV